MLNLSVETNKVRLRLRIDSVKFITCYLSLCSIYLCYYFIVQSGSQLLSVWSILAAHYFDVGLSRKKKTKTETFPQKDPERNLWKTKDTVLKLSGEFT